jgi:hypothetical protein
MSSFLSLLNQISTTHLADSNTSAEDRHNNPHATPTPVDVAAAYRLVQEQLETLARTAPTDTNRDFLTFLASMLEDDIADPPREISGVSPEFIADLDRVPKKKLGDDQCPICAEDFLDDSHPLVVELPCHKSHRFDLECVAPWLQSKGSCPLCRVDFTVKKQPVVVDDSEEEDDAHGMFG